MNINELKCGRHGHKNPVSKLTKEQVEEIRLVTLPKTGSYAIYKTLASKYGVSWGTIRNVLKELTYVN